MRPGPRSKTPVHFDIETVGWLAETERLTSLGATVRERFEDRAWMRDPEGNDFCIVAGDRWRYKSPGVFSARVQGAYCPAIARVSSGFPQVLNRLHRHDPQHLPVTLGDGHGGSSQRRTAPAAP
jgi:hypothetical protein